MKPRQLRKLRLVRPADAFLPAAFLITAFMGREKVAAWTFFAYMIVKLLGLSSSNGVRIAFATQPSTHMAQGSVKGALLTQIAGGLLAFCGYSLAKGGATYEAASLIVVGVLLNIEHEFYEYLYAVGDGGSARLCRLITSVLVAAGMLLAAPAGSGLSQDVHMPWLTGAAGISAVVAAVVSLAIGGAMKGKVNFHVVKCAPRAMLHTLFYPAVAAIALYFRPFGEPAAWQFFAGLIVYELCHTPFRRSPMESRSMNRALIVTCAVAAALQLAYLPNWMASVSLGVLEPARPILQDLPLGAILTILACLCAFAMFGNFPGRSDA